MRDPIEDAKADEAQEQQLEAPFMSEAGQEIFEGDELIMTVYVQVHSPKLPSAKDCLESMILATKIVGAEG